MPTILTVPEIIEIGDVSTYLSANYTSKGALYRNRVIEPVPPVQIAMVTDAIRWGYEGGAQTDQSLRQTANYAYWMYGLFQLQAQNIISGPGGGSVVPSPSGSGCPNDLDFEVTSTSIMATGDTSLSIPQFIGYQVDFSRNGVMQNTTNIGGSYYSWDSVSGIFSISTAATEGELFRIMVDCGCGSGSGGAVTQVFPFLVTSADFEVDGVTLLDGRISTNNVTLFANNFAGNFLIAPTDFVYVSGGIQVIAPGFDANTFNYTILVNKIN